MNVNDPSSRLVDPARLNALRMVALLDTPTEESFDRLTWLAVRFVKAPVALVSLVDANRQFFKSCIGLPEPWSSRRETPLSHSFCRHNLISGQPLVIEDARIHPLFKDNLAIRDLDAIAYLGIPLVTSDGYVLGSFCVIDSKPRQWTEEEVVVVRNLAFSVMTEIQLRTQIETRRRLEEERANLASLNTNLRREVAACRQAEKAREKEYLLSESQRIAHIGSWGWPLAGPIEWTAETYRIYGVSPKTFTPTIESLADLIHPHDRPALQRWLVSCGNGQSPGDLEFRVILPDGSVRILSGRGDLLYDSENRPSYMAGTVQDITERKRVEEELRKSESHLRTLVQTLPDLVWLKDIDGVYLMCNAKFERLYGAKVEDILGKTDYDFVDEELADFFVENDRKAIIAGKPTGNEEWVTFADNGRRVLLETIKTPMHDDRGNLIGVLGIGRDITERKQAEEATANANKLLQTIINTAPMRIFFKDKELRYMGCNIAFARDAGVEHPMELIGKDDYQLAWKEQAELYRIDDLGVIESGIPKLSYDEPQTTPEGNQIWLRTSKVPLRNESDEIIGVLGMYEDITDYQQAKADLLNVRITLEAAIQQTPVPMVLISLPDAVVRIVNGACLEFLGVMDEPTPVGQRLVDFKPSYKDYDADGNLTPLVEAPLAKVVMRGIRTLNQERRVERKDGTSRWALVNANPICNAEGNLIAALLVFPDITEQKHAEEERRRLQNQLIQAQKIESVGQLAGGVAHDFNNMLGVILGHAEMAMQMVDPAQPAFADLEEIRKAAARSADLTRQLLAFARKQTIAPIVLDLNGTIEGLLKMLRRLIGEDINLVWKPGAGLWPVKVDPSQLDQILANLCVNARDAIAGVGKIVVETGNSTCDEDFCAAHSGCVCGEYVRLSVNDTGIGMDKLTLAHIFEPFYTTKGVGKGTGLGLSTVYGAVKQNNGFVEVSSEPGEGTTFSIYLPRHMDAGTSGQMLKEIAIEPTVGGHETILLVEDESAILKMTTTVLQNLGYNVIAASSPGEAIKLSDESNAEIQLLMTDVIMPEMNGRDLADQLMSIQKGMKCLFMSGYTSDIIANQGILVEGMHFIQKPFSRQELAIRIRQVLE